MENLIEIVFAFIKIQLLSFGGGHASIPVVHNEIVEIRHWMNIEEFQDLLAMDELTPGPLAINCATYVGEKLAGIPGAIAATLGCIIPSCILALIFVRAYKKYFQNKLFINEMFCLRAMVIAILAATTITLFRDSIILNSALNYQFVIIFILSFICFMKFKPNPIYIMLLAGCASLIINII